MNSVPKFKSHDPYYDRNSFASQFDEVKELNLEIKRLTKKLDQN